MRFDLIARYLSQPDKPAGGILQPDEPGRQAGRYFNHLALENRVRLRGIEGNNRKTLKSCIDR